MADGTEADLKERAFLERIIRCTDRIVFDPLKERIGFGSTGEDVSPQFVNVLKAKGFISLEPLGERCFVITATTAARTVFPLRYGCEHAKQFMFQQSVLTPVMTLPGTVRSREEILADGPLDLKRLCDLGAIRPATPDELADFAKIYSEPADKREARDKELVVLKDALKSRRRRAKFGSAKAELLVELIRELGTAERVLNEKWKETFGQMGETENQIFRRNIFKGFEYEGLKNKRNAIREAVKGEADTLRVAAAKVGKDFTVLSNYIDATNQRFLDRPTPFQMEAIDWAKALKFQLLADEADRGFVARLKRLLIALFGTVARSAVTIATSLIGAVLAALVIAHLKKMGRLP